MPFTTENCFQGRICIRHMIQYALYMKLTGSRSAGRGIPHLSGGQIVLAKEKCLIFLLRYNVPLQQQLHINRVSLHFQLRPAYFHFSCISSLQLLIPDVAPCSAQLQLKYFGKISKKIIVKSLFFPSVGYFLQFQILLKHSVTPSREYLNPVCLSAAQSKQQRKKVKGNVSMTREKYSI